MLKDIYPNIRREKKELTQGNIRKTNHPNLPNFARIVEVVFIQPASWIVRTPFGLRRQHTNGNNWMTYDETPICSTRNPIVRNVFQHTMTMEAEEFE